MADRFWIGGTGNWNDTAHWSDADGGSGGFSVPGIGDDVKFTASSGGGTCTVNVSASCKNLDFTGYTGVFAGSSGLSVYGNLICDAGQGTPTYSNVMTFKATSSKTLTLNGIAWVCSMYFNGSGGTWTLQDELTCKNLQVQLGTFDSNAKTINCQGLAIASGSAVRTLTITNSTINVADGGLTNVGFQGTTYTNATVNASGSTINITRTSTNTTFQLGTKTWGNVVPSNGITFSESGTVNNLTFTPSLSLDGGRELQVAFGKTLTVAGTLTASGSYSSGTLMRIMIRCTVLNNTATINAAAVDLDYAVIDGIIAGGAAAPFTGTDIHPSRCTNITASSPRTLYWVGNGGDSKSDSHWSTSSGGSSGELPPGPNDSAIFDSNSITSASQTVNLNNLFIGSLTIDAGIANNPTFAAPDFQVINIYGSVSFADAAYILFNSFVTLNIAGISAVNFACPKTGYCLASIAIGQAYMTAGGFTYGSSGTVTCTSDIRINSAETLAILSQTFDANDFDIYAGNFALSGGTVNMGSGTWSCLSGPSAATPWSVTGATLNAETSTIILADASATLATFAGGDKTYNVVTISGSSATNAYRITGSNTFAELNFTGTDKTVKFTAATTQTIGTFNPGGTAGHLAVLTGYTAANWNLVVTGSANADYCNVSYSQASGAATPIQSPHGTDGGNNTGWTFVLATSGASFLTRLM